ncbi:MAG: aspartate-alanine antiporter [Muribaculaceae bacterium]|nr:aspartate-alanine antiporter [Muribaculaceae bacterium]
MLHWFLETFRTYPSIPIFLTIGLGFLIGKLKYKTFSLGTVTSVLLVGVVVGQMNIPIGAPLKALFFLIFLFAIGYKCGPQFVAAIRGQGIKQVIFACVVCVLCLAVTFVCAKIMKYNAAIATGLFSGAQTISAVIGVGTDTIGTLHIPDDQKKQWIDLIPVCYAVTYVFGTVGSAWILGSLGPAMLGGLAKVKKQTKELEEQLNHSSISSDPAYINGNRPISFRAYKVTSEDFFSKPRTIEDIEEHFKSLGRRIFVERVRSGNEMIAAAPNVAVKLGDEVVLSGRHEYIIEDESWIGPEVDDAALLTFNVEHTKVMVTKKSAGMTVDALRAKPFMYGVMIKSITRQGGVQLPVLAQTELMQGDMITIMGLPQEVSAAAPAIGVEEHPTTQTDLVFVSLAIVIGALVGALTINFGDVPVSLSTSGGSLIAGLFFGWLRTKRPSMGIIPDSSLWLMNNLGLNMFIAVIGIQCGPTFISGIKEVGWMLLVMGVIATSVPLLLAMFLGAKVFKFHPAINLGCCAGSRTTTASLGAITAALDSSVPAMGYTITYAIGNTLLILMGVAMVLMFI